MSNGEGKPIVALDIDGTLGDYHRNFLEFADRYFSSDCGSWVEMASRNDNTQGLPLWKWMGIPQRDYRDAKLAYRQGGWKRWMPVYEGASELTKSLRYEGIEVWLCTTRPYLRLDNVDPDTREWLRRNRIEYDALLFDPVHEEDGSKYDELCRQVGDRVACIVDDLPEMVNSAHWSFYQYGVAPIIRDQPYNKKLSHPAWRRVDSCVGIWEQATKDVDQWRENHG